MNWGAIGSIGEVLGSVGVLITLIYFGVQLRKTEAATRNATTSNMQSVRLHANDQKLEYAELFLKGNSGVDLTDLEKSRIQILFQSEYQIMFFIYMNSKRQGDDGLIQARNFASFLCANPIMERAWGVSRKHIKRNSQGVPNPIQDEWLADVSNEIELVKTLSAI
jgi:hypothetical protein